MHSGSNTQHIQTVHPCIGARFSSVINEEEIESFPQKQGQADRWILFPGTLEPRKNITTINSKETFFRRTH
jgi:hypothetical protein